MEKRALDALAESLRQSPDLAAKADIGLVAARLGLAGTSIAVGDDCAAIPDGDGHILFAIEGFINAFLAADPWFARLVRRDGQSVGHRGDGRQAARGRRRDLGRRRGIRRRDPRRHERRFEGLWRGRSSVDTPICERRKASSRLRSSAGPDAGLLTSFDARPGDALIAAIDHRGRYREPFNNWQAALEAPHERLRADLACSRKSPSAGLAGAAKDISQGGIPGTAAMLAESSGVAIDIDMDAIEPPAGVSLDRWLKTFPSFGFLLSASRDAADELLSLFRGRDIHAAEIGAVKAGGEVALVSGARRTVLRDFSRQRLLGLSRLPESAA